MVMRDIVITICWLLAALVVAILTAVFANRVVITQPYSDLTEAALQSAYNEGQKVGLCIAHRNFMKIPHDGCFTKDYLNLVKENENATNTRAMSD